MRLTTGFALLVLVVCGCSGSDVDQKPVFEVSGKVTMAGGPVAKATVVFSPLDKQPVATGITDNSGVFRLTTYDSFDGAAAGKYEVMISKSVAPSVEGGEPAHDPTGKSMDSGAPGHDAEAGTGSDEGVALDPKYSQAGNGLTAEVTTSGPNEFDFKLE